MERELGSQERHHTSERCIASLRGSNRDPIAALVATPVASYREVILGRDKVQNHEIATHNLASREVHRCTFSEFCYIPRDLRLTT